MCNNKEGICDIFKGSFRKGILLVPYVFTMLISIIPVATLARPAGPFSWVKDSGPACTPHISESNTDQNIFRQIECEISTCRNVSRVVYEKTDPYKEGQFMPVFEGINKTCYHTLNNSNKAYSLENRNDYTAFHTKHLLYIKPLSLADQGRWRCVVYEGDSKNCESQPMDVNIYVTPEAYNLNIAPNDPVLVTGQINVFVCKIDGIHPEPKITWIVNGIERSRGIASNKRREDGLWSVVNKITLGFESVGQNVLSCVLKNKDGNPWLQHSLNLDVKETAHVLEPTELTTVHVVGNSTFTLNCSGTGYKPRISWQRSGSTIHDWDSRYSITQMCNETYCRSSMTSKSVENTLTCDVEDHIEVYTCTVTLGLPYQSNQTSTDISVNRLDITCKVTRYGTIIAVGISLMVVAAVLFGFIIVIWRRLKRDNNTPLKGEVVTYSKVQNN